MTNVTLLVRHDLAIPLDSAHLTVFAQQVVAAGLYTTSGGGPVEVTVSVLRANPGDLAVTDLLVVVNTREDLLPEELRIERQAMIQQGLFILVNKLAIRISVHIAQNINPLLDEPFHYDQPAMGLNDAILRALSVTGARV